jgi:aminoglycoside 6'-N-acetyltransferase I
LENELKRLSIILPPGKEGRRIPMVIRGVTAEDHAVWAELRHALWPWDPVEELAVEQPAMLANPQMMNYIAWEDDSSRQPLGFIEMAIRDEAFGSDGQPVPYIEGWYVVPEARGKGVGRALVEQGEEWARRRGFTRVASDTIPQTYTTSPAAHAALGYRIVAEYPAGVVEDEPSMHFIKELTF